MKQELKEGVTHIKECNKVCADIGLMLDDLVNEQVYNKEDVNNSLLVFIHVIVNYMTGEMVKQKCCGTYIRQANEDLGVALKELMIEHLKIDPADFYK